MVLRECHHVSESPSASISLAREQMRQPSPMRSLNSRAVVTLAPTVRDVDSESSLRVGVRSSGSGRGVCTPDWFPSEAVGVSSE